MKNVLYILSDSMVTDTYINIISLCVERFKVKKIVIFHILDDINISDTKGVVYTNIIEQYKNIMEGNYNLYNNATGSYVMEKINYFNEKIANYYRSAYNILLNSIEEKNVNFNDFFLFLKTIKDKNDYVFDITTLKKDVLTNLIPIFIENNIINDIYYFEKTTPWKHNQSDLIHNLNHSDITYNNIIKDETINYLGGMKKSSIKNRIILSGIFVILICLFILIFVGWSSQIISVIGFVLSAISFILYIYDNRLTR